MNKPQSKTVTIYDLHEILKYVENEFEGFFDEMWKVLCEDGYIKNDICTYIPFEDFTDMEYYKEVVVLGVEYLMRSLPEIFKDNVLFKISW